MIVRLARKWGGAPVRAVAILRRGDSLAYKMNLAGGGVTGDLIVGKELREVDGASALLPDPMMLVLDHGEALHLVSLKNGLLLRVGEEVLSWPAGAVTVRTKRGRGERFLRVVEISGEGETLKVLAPGRAKRQRAALELIEQVTGGDVAANAPRRRR